MAAIVGGPPIGAEAPQNQVQPGTQAQPGQEEAEKIFLLVLELTNPEQVDNLPDACLLSCAWPTWFCE